MSIVKLKWKEHLQRDSNSVFSIFQYFCAIRFHQFLIFCLWLRLQTTICTCIYSLIYRQQHPMALMWIDLLIYQSSQMQTIKWNQSTAKRPTTKNFIVAYLSFVMPLFRSPGMKAKQNTKCVTQFDKETRRLTNRIRSFILYCFRQHSMQFDAMYSFDIFLIYSICSHHFIHNSFEFVSF